MEYKYKAFISYRHGGRDELVARLLHGMIEEYEIPEELRKNGQKHPGKVFWDRRSIGAANDLPREITDALDDSEFLIVILSEKTLESKWCRQEIAYFREHRGQEKVLTVLLGGDPKKLMEELLPGMPEQSSLDLRGFGFLWKLREGALKICAPLLGCSYEKLMPSFLKRQQTRLLMTSGVVLSIAAVIIGILLWSNWQIEGKNREILLRESELLTKEAVEDLEAKDHYSAVQKLVQALPGKGNERLSYGPAEKAMLDALDLFSGTTTRCVPKVLTIRQNDEVKKMHFSEDGSRLFTSDSDGDTTCFDTVTGEQLWYHKIEKGRLWNDSDNTGARYGEQQIFLCTPWNSILILDHNTIISISQDTGKVLWSQGSEIFNQHFTLSHDGRYLYVVNHVQDRLALVCISTENGEALGVYPVTEPGMDVLLYEDPALAENTDVYDISTDGRFFGGCYLWEVNADITLLVYFVTDLHTGTTEILDLEQSDYVYDVFFSDDDTALSVLREAEDNYDCLDTVRISDHALIRQIEFVSELHFAQSTFYDPKADYIPYNIPSEIQRIQVDDCVLFGIGKYLLAIDMKNCKVLDAEELEANLIHLEAVQGGYFTLVLEDGSYRYGDVSQYGIFISNYLKDESLCFFDDVILSDFWNKGYLQYREDDVTVGSQENGFGFCAYVPQDAPDTVVIRRAVDFTPQLDQKLVGSLLEDVEEEYIYYWSITICEDDVIALDRWEERPGSTEYHCQLLDRITLTPLDSFSVPFSEIPEYGPVLLKGGSGILYSDLDMLKHYDFAARESRTIAPMSGSIGLKKGTGMVSAQIVTTDSVRNPVDHSVYTVMCTELGLKLWKDARPLADALFPEGFQFSEEHFLVGENGFVLLDVSEGSENSNCYLYSIAGKDWYSVPVQKSDREQRVTALGSSTAVFAIVDDTEMIRVYDIQTGAEKAGIPVYAAMGDVCDMRFFGDDRYLSLFTDDDCLYILDLSTSELVFSFVSPYTSPKSEDYGINYEDPFVGCPYFSIDKAQKRLYMWRYPSICVDMENWIILEEFNLDTELFDPVSDWVFLHEDHYESKTWIKNMIAVRLPKGEELAELGRQYLNE